MDAFKIEITRISAVFSVNNKHFYADLNDLGRAVKGETTECMIFKANKKGEVIDWSAVYCMRDIPVNKDSLIFCIKDFCEENGFDYNEENYSKEAKHGSDTLQDAETNAH